LHYASSCRTYQPPVADVAGHGTKVAATASDLRTLMRRFVNRLDQTEFVRLLNQQFMEMAKEAVFATAVVSTYFAPSRRLTVCNAGHPRPLMYRASQQRWDFLGHDGPSSQPTPSNIPLGLIELRITSSLTSSWSPAIAWSAIPTL
jgi:serine phosphatase RsbU (regulator of sigma subunit)